MPRVPSRETIPGNMFAEPWRARLLEESTGQRQKLSIHRHAYTAERQIRRMQYRTNIAQGLQQERIKDQVRWLDFNVVHRLHHAERGLTRRVGVGVILHADTECWKDTWVEHIRRPTLDDVREGPRPQRPEPRGGYGQQQSRLWPTPTLLVLLRDL